MKTNEEMLNLTIKTIDDLVGKLTPQECVVYVCTLTAGLFNMLPGNKMHELEEALSEVATDAMHSEGLAGLVWEKMPNGDYRFKKPLTPEEIDEIALKWQESHKPDDDYRIEV